jgi:iron complex transport system permease protein
MDFHFHFVYFGHNRILSLLSIKPLNALLLGENYARSRINSKTTIIIATSILAGA